MQSQLKQKYIKHRPRKFVLLQNKNLNHANFMMIGDSFMRMMIPYAAERFTQSLFYNPWACKNEHNCHFPEKLIQRFSPDILLLQVVERRFQACKSRLSKACQTKVNGKMPFKIKQMRLKAKFDTGEPLTRIAQLKKTNVKNKFVIDASSTFVTVPNDAIVVAKLTFPTQTSGIVKPIRNKLPLRVKHEQTRVRLKPNMKSAYLVLDYDRLKNKAYISFEKTNIDFNNFKFELKYFKDRTSLINFKEALQLSNRKDHSHHKILK